MKMEGLSQLVLFSVVMLFGSYVAGSLPLFMPMSEEKLHLVSVMGAGLLLGVAFAVIVPEGMQTLIKAFQISAKHRDKTDHTETEGESHDHADPLDGIDRVIGVSLVLGFLFMLLVDQIATSHSHSPLPSTDAESPRHPSPARSRSGGGRSSVSSVSWTTTLGLVVHAAADGIAMGAAAATHQVDVEMIVFLAIMLHKAPAAFGLVTFLMHENVERNRIRKHLLTFAFSAPVMAISTFLLLAASKGDTTDEVGTFQATGVAMLFSAGTFLYVSTVHVLPEVTNTGGKGFSKCELLMLVVGCLLPLLLTVGHHH